MFRCYSYTIIRERINSCLLKLQLLKYFINIKTILTTVNVSGMQEHMLLHTRHELMRPTDDGVTVIPKHVGSCFNVHFNVNFTIVF